MNNFVVSARKYRPARFEEVVGQEHVTQTLKNAIRNDQLAQSFLFCGPRGVGKTTCARILAKVINCQNLNENIEACGECDSCQAALQSNSFNIFELDAASNNSVEDMRNLIEQVRFAPQTGQYKVYIIDEVHMLSQAAFNAFLKTLEEPPSYAIFILATTEKHKIIPTILSRCQIFDFYRISEERIVSHLQEISKNETVEAEEDALHLIAEKADGGLRDALSIFDRMVSFSNGKIIYQDILSTLSILDYDYYFQITDAILTQDNSSILIQLNEILQKGFEPDLFINGLAKHFRNLLVAKDTSTHSLLKLSPNLQKRYKDQAPLTPSALLVNALNLCSQCELNLKSSKNARLLVEITLIKLCHLTQVLQIPAAELKTPLVVTPKIQATPKPPITTPQTNNIQATTAAKIETPKTPTPPPTKVEDPKTIEKITPPQAIAHQEEIIKTPIKEEAKTNTEKPIVNEAPVEYKIATEPTPPSNTSTKGKIQLKDTKSINIDLNKLNDGLELFSAPKPLPTQEDILAAWNNHAMTLSSNRTKAVFNSYKPTYKDKQISIEVNLNIDRTAVIDEKSKFMDILRTNFNMQDISFEKIVVKEQAEVSNKKPKVLVSSMDKYKAMKEINPELETLRNRLKLDLEY